MTICDELCVDLQTDDLNCGECGHSCLGESCVDGLCTPVVLADEGTCGNLFAANETHLYWVATNAVSRVAKAGGDVELVSTESNTCGGRLVLDATTVYFAPDGYSGSYGTIRTVPLEGGTSTLLVSGESVYPFFLSGSTLAWSNYSLGLRAVSTSGGTPIDLVSGQPSQTIALVGSDLYYVYGGIRKVSVAGGGWTEIFSAVATQGAIGHLIESGGVLYWQNNDGTALMKAPTAGGNPELFLTTDLSPVITDGTTFYLSDHKDIFKVPVAGGTPALLAHDGTLNIGSYALDDEYLYWIRGGKVRRVPK
jgi:hypothetical protein